MKVDEMLRELDYDDRGPEAGVLLTLKEAKAIQAKLRAAEELGIAARVACKLSTENHMPWMRQLKLMHDAYEKSGTDEARP